MSQSLSGGGSGQGHEQSVDYANYLLELTKEKRIFIQEHKYRATVANLNIEKVTAKLMSMEELKEKEGMEEEKSSDSESIQSPSPKHKEEKVAVVETVSRQEKEAASRGNAYRIEKSCTKEDITQLVMDVSRPEADKALLRKWIDGFLPALQQNAYLLGKPNVTQMLGVRGFKDSLKKGIPTEVRGDAWEAILGNELRISDKLYDALLARVRLCEENLESEVQFRKNIKVIESDLHRTYSHLGHFRFGEKLYQPLKNILAAYSVFRLDLGYVQGMSYIAGSFLLHTGDEV